MSSVEFEYVSKMLFTAKPLPLFELCGILPLTDVSSAERSFYSSKVYKTIQSAVQISFIYNEQMIPWTQFSQKISELWLCLKIY